MTAQNTLDISGKLVRNPLVELLIEIEQIGLDGSLRLAKDEQKIIIYFDKGKTVFAVSNSRKHRFYQHLLNENRITSQHLREIENFMNDLFLAQTLIRNEIFSKEEINSFLTAQVESIIKDAVEWDEGVWSFDPLARAKEAIRFDVNNSLTFFDFAKKLDDQKILSRFKSFSEEFRLHPAANTNLNFNFSPHEAYLLSRIGETNISIDDLRMMSGLSNNEMLKALYALWAGGLIQRFRWSSAFTVTELSKINSASLTLKTSARSIDEEISKTESQKAKELAEEEARKAEEETKKQAEAEKPKEEKSTEPDISLEEYLNRVESAATHYDIFAVKSTAEISVIKKIYFALAKKFHPDLFHKQVDPQMETRIQNAFTELAHAYDTLRDDEAREVYNFKLRKVLESIEKDGIDAEIKITKEDFESSGKESLALENFDQGYDLLMNNNFYDALPYLGRAVHLANDNARYHAFYGKALSLDESQRRKAETEFQMAIKLEPNNTMYRLMLAELFVDIGLMARAKGELNRLLRIAPNDQEALSLLDSLENK